MTYAQVPKLQIVAMKAAESGTVRTDSRIVSSPSGRATNLRVFQILNRLASKLHR